MSEQDKIKVKFVPGCFDDFEGTQEELDKLVKEIQGLAESGELFEMAQEMDFDELMENEEFAEVVQQMHQLEETNERKLH